MQIDLAAYTKAGSLSYTSPQDQRFFTAKAKRLIRLARRIHDGRLFLPEIVTALREAANQLIALGAFLLLTEKGSAFLDDLFWITSAQFAPEGLDYTVQERSRFRENTRCSLCRSRLVWPAQIVWRKGLEIVDVSSPIGIGCLTRTAGKLEPLIAEIRAVLERYHAEGPSPNPLDRLVIPDSIPATGPLRGTALSAPDTVPFHCETPAPAPPAEAPIAPHHPSLVRRVTTAQLSLF
jgi:hypothetical protein